MLRITSSTQRVCDGTTRRDLLRVGALTLFGGVTLPGYLRAAAAQRRDTPKPGR